MFTNCCEKVEIHRTQQSFPSFIASSPNIPFQESALFLFMSDFLHLLSPNPAALFREPPPSFVKAAQNRSVYDFFISYRHKMSQHYAQSLASELQEFGYKVYFAGQVLGLEDDQLREELQTELHKSSVLAIVGNKDLLDGEWVRWEMDTFNEDHWGRRVPIITEEMGSPISNEDSLSDYVLKRLRKTDTSAAIIYEEDEDAWKNQKPSSTTLFCLLLVREFYRVELDYWHQWTPMSAEDRSRSYLETLFQDRVCRTIMLAMNRPNRDASLAKLKRRDLIKPQEKAWHKFLKFLGISAKGQIKHKGI